MPIQRGPLAMAASTKPIATLFSSNRSFIRPRLITLSASLPTLQGNVRSISSNLIAPGLIASGLIPRSLLRF